MSVIKPDFETACDMVRDFARKYVRTQPYARLDKQNRQLHIGLRELNQYATGTGFDKPLRFDLPNGFGWLAKQTGSSDEWSWAGKPVSERQAVELLNQQHDANSDYRPLEMLLRLSQAVDDNTVTYWRSSLSDIEKEQHQ